MSYVARLRGRITMYSVATAVLLGVFCVLLVVDGWLNQESRLGFAITSALGLLIAVAAVASLFWGDRAGPLPALLLVFSHALLAILFLTVLNTPRSVVGIMLQIPVLALYTGVFLSPTLARTAQAIVLLSFSVTVLWDPSNSLDETANGRNLPNLVLFTWICLEAGIFVQKRFKKTNHIDELTGVYNRRGLIDRSDIERARAERSGRPVTIVVIDLDGFKHINDTQGHAEGDRVLRDLAHQWKTRLRETDVVARLGGDEFILVLPETDLDGARQVLGELRLDPVHPWSWGAAEWNVGELLSIPIAQADDEMYREKTSRKRDGYPLT